MSAENSNDPLTLDLLLASRRAIAGQIEPLIAKRRELDHKLAELQRRNAAIVELLQLSGWIPDLGEDEDEEDDGLGHDSPISASAASRSFDYYTGLIEWIMESSEAQFVATDYAAWLINVVKIPDPSRSSIRTALETAVKKGEIRIAKPGKARRATVYEIPHR